MTSPDQPGQPSEDTNESSEEATEPSQDTQQSPGRFALSRDKSRWLWITLPVIAVAGLSVALINVAIGAGTHQATSGGPSVLPGAPPVTTTSTSGSSSKAGQVPNGTSTAAGSAPSAAQLAESGGALTLPTSMKSRVAKWQSGYGGTDLAAVSRLFGDALQAAGIRQYSAMKYACSQLAASVPTAKAGPQIPDAAMQMLYAKALVELAKGAADCQAAITSKPNGDESIETHVDATVLHLSVSELAAGARDIFRSTAEIEIVSRQHH